MTTFENHMCDLNCIRKQPEINCREWLARVLNSILAVYPVTNDSMYSIVCMYRDLKITTLPEH